MVRWNYSKICSMAGLQLVQLILVNWPEHNFKEEKKLFNLFFSYIICFALFYQNKIFYYTLLCLFKNIFNFTLKCNTRKDNVIYIL